MGFRLGGDVAMGIKDLDCLDLFGIGGDFAEDGLVGVVEIAVFVMDIRA